MQRKQSAVNGAIEVTSPISPVPVGHMSPAHKETLKSLHAHIVEEVDAKHLMDVLYQNRVFTDEMKDEILSKQTRHEQMRELLDKLKYRDSNAFDVFVDVLKKDYPHIAESVDEELSRQTLVQTVYNLKLHLANGRIYKDSALVEEISELACALSKMYFVDENSTSNSTEVEISSNEVGTTSVDQFNDKQDVPISALKVPKSDRPNLTIRSHSFPGVVHHATENLTSEKSMLSSPLKYDKPSFSGYEYQAPEENDSPAAVDVTDSPLVITEPDPNSIIPKGEPVFYKLDWETNLLDNDKFVVIKRKHGPCEAVLCDEKLHVKKQLLESESVWHAVLSTDIVVLLYGDAKKKLFDVEGQFIRDMSPGEQLLSS
ncbi:unnamed protein product [Owenia fusiformis]|uniref:CARD domain-containing protein n=1 Tax=Owenia fusiformis TaxID=6347 RepID=A0A8S4NHJ5_OWEFU|nr:unnamed protein product [Owenia fusiformis]